VFVEDLCPFFLIVLLYGFVWGKCWLCKMSLEVSFFFGRVWEELVLVFLQIFSKIQLWSLGDFSNDWFQSSYSLIYSDFPLFYDSVLAGCIYLGINSFFLCYPLCWCIVALCLLLSLTFLLWAIMLPFSSCLDSNLLFFFLCLVKCLLILLILIIFLLC
jgi:hypothetical protein